MDKDIHFEDDDTDLDMLPIEDHITNSRNPASWRRVDLFTKPRIANWLLDKVFGAIRQTKLFKSEAV
jgi:hypothetical protein